MGHWMDRLDLGKLHRCGPSMGETDAFSKKPGVVMTSGGGVSPKPKQNTS